MLPFRSGFEGVLHVGARGASCGERSVTSRRRTELRRGLVTHAPQLIAAVSKVMPIGSEHFERDRAVVAAALDRSNHARQINVARAERQVQIGGSALVIVEVDVPQT